MGWGWQNMSAPEWDEEHEHTDAELMELWMRDVLGVELAPWQRVFLNDVVQRTPRVDATRECQPERTSPPHESQRKRL